MSTSTLEERPPPPQQRAVAEGRTGFLIGRVSGVEIRLDWSLIVVFVLITLNLGAGLFPAQHPDWSPAAAWITGLLAAVLFFASVLAHELAHAVVGRRYGVPIDGITLFIFGGMARMTEEPKTPKAELAMAIVGPITSLVIGVVAILVGSFLVRGTGAPPEAWMRNAGPAATLLLWLGPINVLLGVFNLLPAFPLDGGRVLRAIIWRATGDLHAATRWASGIGRVAAMLLIFAGVLMLFGHRIPYLGSGPVQGLWLILIGWFLMSAAVESYRQTVARGLYRGLPASRLMRSSARPVSENDTAMAVAERFLQDPRERCLPVVNASGHFAGLVCLSDLAKLPRDQWATRTAREVMTPAASVAAAAPGEDAADVLARMAARDVNQVPVLEDGEVRGFVPRGEVIRWLEQGPDRALTINRGKVAYLPVPAKATE
jgi:Zn-dependent protease/CBS domain-containing protein